MSGKVEPDDYGGADGGTRRKRDELTPEEREAAAKYADLFRQGHEATAKREEEEKRRRRPATRTKLPIQPLADGGVVQPAPDAGIAQDDFSKAIAAASAAGTPVEIQSPDGTLARFGKTDAGTPPQAGFMAPEPVPQGTPQGGGSYLGAVASGVGDAIGAGVDALKQAPMALMRVTGQAPAAPAPTPAAAPVREQTPEALQALAGMPTSAPAEAPTPALPAQPAPGVPVGSGTRKAFDAGVEQQLAGLDALAQMQAAKDAAIVEQQDRFLAERQSLQATFEANLAAQQQRAEEMSQAILADKIDPNRIWNNASVGQRVTAGIGIMLSGIGVGLAGGPNLALQQIQRTIDLDLEAQRENLQTKKGLLSFYLQQGKDMISAYQLAKADLSDVYAAQMQRVAAQFGGQESLARATMAAGELRQGAALKRQEIMGRDFALAGQRLAFTQAQAQARLGTMFGGMERGPSGGLMIPPQMMESIPKEMRERRVRLPDGSWGFAASKEQGTKAAEAMRVADNVRQSLQGLTRLQRDGKPRIPSGIGGDMATAKSQQRSLMLQLKDLNTLGALTGPDMDVLADLVPDITSWTTRDVTMRQQLEALAAELDRRVSSNMKVLVGAF